MFIDDTINSTITRQKLDNFTTKNNAQLAVAINYQKQLVYSCSIRTANMVIHAFKHM